MSQSEKYHGEGSQTTNTYLRPFYRQALSIRPDVLSPRAMVELQQLCDKVPTFPSDIAMATIEKELGRLGYQHQVQHNTHIIFQLPRDPPHSTVSLTNLVTSSTL